MKREEGRDVDTNGLDSRRSVCNGLDRGRVDIVVDGVDIPAREVLAFQVLLLLLLLLKAMPRWNTISEQYPATQ